MERAPRLANACTLHNKDLLIGDVSRSTEILKRDICLLCENIFFAQGEYEGYLNLIDMTDQIVKTL